MRALKAIAIVGVALAAGVASAHPSAQETLEDKIKAAIVSKFPQFVEWPPAAVNGRSTVDLCVVSSDPIQGELAELVTDETLGTRRLTVRRVERDQDVDACHVLFIRAAAVPSHRSLLQRASTLPVLTVSDDQKFLEQGGIVRLRQIDGRLRFDIDAGAAHRAGLRISSQMLQLAASVRGGPA